MMYPPACLLINPTKRVPNQAEPEPRPVLLGDLCTYPSGAIASPLMPLPMTGEAARSCCFCSPLQACLLEGTQSDSTWALAQRFFEAIAMHKCLAEKHVCNLSHGDSAMSLASVPNPDENRLPSYNEQREQYGSREV